MAKVRFDAPIFSLTPAESRERAEKAAQNINTDPDVQYMYDAAGGGFLFAGRDTLVGTVGMRLGMAFDDAFADTPSDPLNLSKSKSEYNPVSDPATFGGDNNPEGVAEMLKTVPYSEWPFILSSNSYAQMVDRTMFIKAGLPEAQSMVSGAEALAATGIDLAALTAIGIAAEPLAIAGLGARTTLAGRAASVGLGSWRSQAMAEAAAEAAATVSRLNLTARFAALGVAEEAMYHSLRNGLDPVYDPSATSVMLQLAGSGTIAGVLGGGVFGRAFVRSHIEEAADEFRRLRTTELPGGYTITWGDRVQFNAPAAADQMLFAPGALSMVDETRRVGRDLFFDWKRRADLGVVDTNIPGTRTLPLGEVPIAGAPRPVRSLAEEIAEEAQRPLRPTVGKTAKPTIGIRSAIKAAAFELSLAGVELTEEVFAMLGRALVNTNGRRLQAGGFNKAFWEEVTSNISPEAAARLRPTAERAFIPGVDRTVMDAVVRDDMVTEIWNHFRAGTHMDPAGEKSLIFQVLQEIRERGGMVNRKVVEDVVDGLREISQKPPKRINAKGKEVLDANARRAAVIKIINEKIGTAKGAKLSAAARAEIKAKPMYLPASLLNKMSVKTTGAGGAGAAGAGLLGPSPAPMGGGADFSNVPQLRQWFTERMPLLSPLFNQAARAMESNNGAARLVAWLSFNARRALDKAQPQTIFESGTMLLHKTMFTFLKGYRNGYVRFAMGGGVENVPAPTNIGSVMRHAFGKRELQRQFNQRVIKQLRTGNYDDALSAVNETAQGFRQIFNSIHEVAAEAGLRGFTKGAVRNYMPRVWRFDKIRRLATTEAGKQDLISLIRTAIDQDGRRVVIDGVEQVFTDDIDEAATAFANRLIDIARGSENAPLTQQDQELFDSLSELLGPIKAKTASKTPFGRGRLLLNEEASVALRNNPFNDNTNTLSLADLTNDDLPFVFRKYITSVMGAVNEKRLLDAFNAEMKARGVFGPRFVTGKGEVLQNEVEVDTVDKMLALVNKLGDTMEKGTMEGLREVIGAIRYEPIHQGSQGIFDKTLGIALPFGYLTTGGQFGLAALGELSRIVGTLGLRNTIQQMPILVEMLKNWKNLDLPAQNFASFIDSWLAPSTDRMRRALFDPTVDAVRSAEIGGGGAIYNGVKRVLDSTANVMSDISGLAPITSFTQQLTAATSVQHLYDVAKGVAKRLDPATVRTLGLEPAQYEEAIRFVGANAKVENRFLGSRVVDMANIDQKEMDLVKTFVNRMVRTRIQDMPTRGDFHKHAFSFLGRLLTQFRTFNLKGVDNFLVQNAGRLGRGGGVKVVQEISATLLFAGLIQYGRNYADLKSYEAANNKKKVEELEKTLTIPGFIRGAMTGPAEFSFLTIGADALWTSTVSPDPLFSPYRYSGLNWYGFPGEAIYNRTKAVIGDVYGATVGQAMETGLEGEITESTVHKARLLLPFQNIIGVKQFLNVAEEEIDVLFNLNRNQPRKSRN